MSSKLDHRQVQAAMSALTEAKIVNLEAPISSLVNPIADSMAKSGVGGEISLHILCCNEYFLVTGLQGGGVGEVERLADSIRSAITQAQKV
jgi:hypothetical protein